MRIIIRVVLFFFGIVCITPIYAHAETTSAQAVSIGVSNEEVIRQCREAVSFLDSTQTEQMKIIKSNDNIQMNIGYCLGLIAGTLSAYESLQKINGYSKDLIGFCRPKEFTTLQGARVFLKWVKEHPEQINFPASILILTALSDTFPCGK